MKALILLLPVVAAYVAINQEIAAIQSSTRFQNATFKIPIFGEAGSLNAGEISELKAKLYPDMGSKRVKVRYGPYDLPAWGDRKATNKFTGEGGMVDKTWFMAKKPCSDCLITYVRAGLEYADGTTANANTGSWLHHLDLYLSGPGRKDVVCPFSPVGELMWADGNERKVFTFGSSKAGYYVKSSDRFTLLTELMNMDQKPQKVFVTVTFEYIPGKPKGFSNSRLVWLDVVGCGKPSSEINPLNDKTFVFKTKTWSSAISGTMLAFAGHEHDGGSNVELVHNGKVACASEASYGGPGYVSKNMMGSKMEMTHMSNMKVCHDMGRVNKGDKLQVKAYYDFEKYPGLRTVSGKLDQVMGIGGLYISQPLK